MGLALIKIIVVKLGFRVTCYFATTDPRPDQSESCSD